MKRAFLEVRASNEAAQDMYRKFGFEISGRRVKYYKDNGEDAILMTLESLDTPPVAAPSHWRKNERRRNPSTSCQRSCRMREM